VDIHGRARIVQPSIAIMRYELATKGSRFYSREWLEIFLISTASRTALGSIQWIPGASSPGIKQPRCVADHPPQSSVGVKNARCICASSLVSELRELCLYILCVDGKVILNEC
jgi:hypothetical protein